MSSLGFGEIWCSYCNRPTPHMVKVETGGLPALIVRCEICRGAGAAEEYRERYRDRSSVEPLPNSGPLPDVTRRPVGTWVRALQMRVWEFNRR